MRTTFPTVLLVLAVLAGAGRVTAGEPANGVPLASFADADALRHFEWDRDDLDLSVGPRSVTEQGSVLKMVVRRGEYPNLALRRKEVPRDWSAYEALSFTVWSTGERELAVRVDDAKSAGYASRYNGGARLVAGRTRVQIPIATIAKSIDVRAVTALVLFLDHPPAGVTLWFDDLRLGRMEADQVPFIPYAERLDRQPTLAVATPHLPFARGLAGGPLKAFAIAGVRTGREVVELMERIDLDPRVLSWDREWGENTWGFGDAYGQRGHGLDCALMQRYLASTLCGPEHFEVLLLSTPMGWNRFGLAARQALLARVRDRGEGLVLLMPFPGDRDQPWPDDLRALSALIDGASDWADDGGGMHVPKEGREFGGRWVAQGAHPLTAGVPLDALPTGEMETQRCTPAPGAQVLISLANGTPVLAVRQVGKGRVVTIAARTASLTPHMAVPDGFAERPPYRYWEAWYALLARAAAWAGDRPLARQGAAQVAAVAGADADPWYTVRQWKDAHGAVTDWELGFADPDPAFLRIKVQAPATVAAGAPIALTFTAPGGARDATWTALLGEPGDGRWRTLGTLPVDAATGGVTVPTTRVRAGVAQVRVQARRAGRLIGEGLAEVVVTPSSAWDDYETLTWCERGLPFLGDLEMARMRDFGLSSNTAGGDDPGEWRRLLRNGMRLHPVGFANGLHVEDLESRMRDWRERKDRSALIRHPSFSDPDFAAAERARVQKLATAMAPYAPLSLITSDETSLTSYTTEFDLDEHPANVAAFRAGLEKRFGTIAALNAAFATTFAGFDQVAPQTGQEAKDSGHFGLWNAWRDHNDTAWAGVFRLYADAVRAGYPAARLSVSGTQEQAVFNGIDWAKLSPELGAVCGYGGRYQELQRLCWGGPELRATPWCGYGRSGPSVAHQVWSNLLAGGDGTALFWWPSLHDPDWTFCQSGRDYQVVLAELSAGLGRQYMLATRRFSPVAVLWSAASQRAAWARGRFEEFKQAETMVMEALYAAGADPFLISDAEIAAGALAKRGVRVLALPMSVAIGRGEVAGGSAVLPAVQGLLDRGGLVLATDEPELDEFLRPAPLPPTFAQRLTRFAAVKGALGAALAKAGAPPYAPLTATPGTTAVLHDLPAPAGASPVRLLTLLRAPVGSHEVIGADGVGHVERDAGAGPEVETVKVDLSGFGAVTCIDCRSGAVVKQDGRVISVPLHAGEGHPLALCAAADAGFEATAKVVAGDLQVAWQLRGGSVFVPHVAHVEVSGADGVLRHLTRNVTTGSDGRGAYALPLADEEDGALRVRVRDVVSGTVMEVPVAR